MTDAYRTAGFVCPTCPNSALREFQSRLVCDECNGMMIGADDVVTSIHELDGLSGSVSFSDATPSKKPCPRCQGAMTSAEVVVGHTRVYGHSLHCEKHGVWISQGAH